MSAQRITCPACGGENPGEAVFCGNPICKKALGEFRYVREELAAIARWYETLADRIAAFVGKPHFLLIHFVWFILWIVVNTGLVAMGAHFDEYPFGLLGIILAIEAILITGVLLISQNRQNAHADKRGELDYEVNVRTYRKLHEVEALLQSMATRLERLEARAEERRG